MTDTFDPLVWPRALITGLLVFAFLPGLVLRLLVRLYPKDHPRRTELLGQLYAMPQWRRPWFVVEQLETALSEGLPTRISRGLQRIRNDRSRSALNITQLNEQCEVRLAELVMRVIADSTDAELPLDIDAELAGLVLRVDNKRQLMLTIARLLDNAEWHGGLTRVELRKREDGDILIAVEDACLNLSKRDRLRNFRRANPPSLGRRSRRASSKKTLIDRALVSVEDRPDGQPGARFVITLPGDESRLDPLAS